MLLSRPTRIAAHNVPNGNVLLFPATTYVQYVLRLGIASCVSGTQWSLQQLTSPTGDTLNPTSPVMGFRKAAVPPHAARVAAR